MNNIWLFRSFQWFEIKKLLSEFSFSCYHDMSSSCFLVTGNHFPRCNFRSKILIFNVNVAVVIIHLGYYLEQINYVTVKRFSCQANWHILTMLSERYSNLVIFVSKISSMWNKLSSCCKKVLFISQNISNMHSLIPVI